MATNPIKQAIKSKTINFNLWAPVLVGVLSLFGVTIPLEVALGVMGLANIALRYTTTKPVNEK